MPRNEFQARGFYLAELEEMTDLQLQDLLRAGQITRDDIRWARKTPAREGPVKGSTDLEGEPVEDASSDRDTRRPNPADYRRDPGDITTRTHIAEVYGAEDTPLI